MRWLALASLGLVLVSGGLARAASRADCLASQPADPAGSRTLASVPPDRLHALSRGVNLTRLFAPDASEPHLHDDMALLQRWGFRHVRIPVDPARIVRSDDTSRAAYLKQLDAGVCAALQVGLAVIIDLHDTHALQLRDNSGDQVTQDLGSAWDVLAGRYRGVPASHMFFEVANEPDMSDEARWEAIQTVLLGHIRAIAPGNTVILTATPRSTFWALAHSKTADDGNAVYNFHFYTPMLFTHQTAEWLRPSYKSLRGLAYPGNSANVALVSAQADEGLRAGLAHYGQDLPDQAFLAKQLNVVIQWGREHSVPLVVTEFGVQHAAPDASRANWFRDVRTVLEQASVGWTVWEYQGGFGIKPDLEAGCHGTSAVPAGLGLCN